MIPLGLKLFCDEMGEVKANLKLMWQQCVQCVWTGLCVYLQAIACLLQLFLGHIQLLVNRADSNPNCEAFFVPSLCPLTLSVSVPFCSLPSNFFASIKTGKQLPPDIYTYFHHNLHFLCPFLPFALILYLKGTKVKGTFISFI